MKKSDLGKIDITKNQFIELTELAKSVSKVRVNFIESRAVLDIKAYGNFLVDATKRNYNDNIEELEKNFRVTIDLGKMTDAWAYIAEKREGYKNYEEFIKTLAKKHDFSEGSVFGSKDPEVFFSLDSEEIEEKIELAREAVKVADYINNVQNGRFPQVPRLKKLDPKKELKKVRVNSYTFLHGLASLAEKKKTLLDLLELVSEFYGESLSSNNFFHKLGRNLTLAELLKLESMNMSFQIDDGYKKIKTLNVLTEIGD